MCSVPSLFYDIWRSPFAKSVILTYLTFLVSSCCWDQAKSLSIFVICGTGSWFSCSRILAFTSLATYKRVCNNNTKWISPSYRLLNKLSNSVLSITSIEHKIYHTMLNSDTTKTRNFFSSASGVLTVSENSIFIELF